ncbi:MAG: hypothetical protein VX466_09955 [Myxococcota bacterium]|nr:hypothetical protein [Myxococcota bacterium]
MSTFIRSLLFGACFVILLGTPARPARACSVCLAGDPIFSAQGTTAQAQGDVSVYLEARGWSKRSGHLPHGEHGEHGEEEEEESLGEREVEKNDSRRLDLFVSWTPIDRLTFTIDVPWAFNEVVEIEGDERTHSTEAGLGDIALQTSFVFWRNREILPSTWVEGRAFLKLPSGQSKQKVDGIRDPHLQAGTGSWDFGFGLAATHKLDWGSIYSSAFYRVNAEGSLDYEYGDIVLVNLGSEIPLGHFLGVPRLDYFTPGLEVNFRYSEKDKVDGEFFEDSGGSILYLTPSLRIRLPKFGNGAAPSLRVAVQIPASDSWLHGFQDEDPIWFAGIGYSF